jgi:hypothetical protein
LKEAPGKAFVCRDTNKPDLYSEVAGKSTTESLEEARVCFYGQKAKNLLSIMNRPYFKTRLRTIADSEAHFRIYNFAGNPVMVKLVDRLHDDKGNVVDHGFDTVFDVAGQKLHDVVPGAYIAKQAGAYLCDLAGVEISEATLARRLLHPNERMTYVLASIQHLAKDLCAVLQKVDEN